MNPSPWAVGLLAAVSLAACGDDGVADLPPPPDAGPSGTDAGPGQDSGPPPTTGSLRIDVVGAAGLVADIAVTGPGSFTRDLTSAQTLADLDPGSYTVTAAGVQTTGIAIESHVVQSVTGSPATVVAGETEVVTVTYRHLPGTGRVWVTSGNNSRVYAYAPGQLAATGNPVPSLQLDSTSDGSLEGPTGIAVDGQGNLWLANGGSGNLVKFAAADLAVAGSPEPVVQIEAGFTFASSIAFDAAGNLWTADQQDSTLSRYNASQLTASSSQAPARVIDSTSLLDGPYDFAFDAAGNLWVANYNDDRVLKFAAGGLAAGTPAPAVTLRGTSVTVGGSAEDSIFGPSGLEFDGSGNLWVVNNANDSVAKFLASQLGASGTPAPAVLIVNAALGGPQGAALDAAGNLWIAAWTDDALVRYSSSQLAASGRQAPAVVIDGAGTHLDHPYNVMIDPPPAGSPIRAP